MFNKSWVWSSEICRKGLEGYRQVVIALSREIDPVLSQQWMMFQVDVLSPGASQLHGEISADNSPPPLLFINVSTTFYCGINCGIF